ncbi:hypothetical protein JCM9279_005192 [Rhodotorula babjevae]
MMRPTLFSAAVLLSAALSSVHAAVFNCVGGSVYAVAHPDDDLLFQSPTLLDDVDSGECITSIFLTSGDSGAGSAYARSRETGNQAAYSQMFGVNNTWTEFYATFGGQPVLIRTLVAKPQHQAVFFRLPDGGWDTGGFSATGFQTLRGLYFGSISSITNQPGDATYTLATLKQAISQILAARQPARVRTLDYLSDFGGGDHDDHLTTGRLVKDLVSVSVSGFMGYPVQNLAPTLSTTSTAFKRKTDAFFAYTPYDSAECQSLAACASRGEAAWLQREYAVTSALATKAGTSTPQTPFVPPSTPNLAPLAVASSSSNEAGSIPFAAIDGVISGYPRNESAEWASDHQGAGAWFKLTWPQAVSIATVVLYDRPNSADWLKAGTLTASDGSSISFTNTVNDGSAFVIQLPVTVTTTSLLLTVTQVSSTTASVGLSEIQVYGATSTASSTSSAPASTATASASGNLALSATASASSAATATSQTADKAIDGVVNGYREDGSGDYTKEWATDHQGAGATLTLLWTSPVTANQVVLFDRVNLNDQVTSATITFSDGSSVAVPALNNAGGATTVSFTAKTFTSLVFTVNSVSSTTSNVGLAEIQVFLAAASTASATSVIPASSSSVAVTSSTAASTSTAAAPASTGSLDLALNATASASTWNDATNQTPDKAIDGVVNGYRENGSGDYTKEWASDHEGAGATLALTWTSSITANRVVLFDRPNLNDQITSGYIKFSDQSTVTVPTLANDGSATTIDFASKTFSSAVFYITGVSNTTSNVGLAEFQVFYVAASSAAASSSAASPTPPSSAAAAASSSAASSSATLVPSDTTSSAAPAATSTRSTIVFSSAASSPAAASSASSVLPPASSAPASTSAASSTAAPAATGLVNFARQVQALSASTAATATSQTADKAVDGVVNGYRENGSGDYTKEWATDHQGAGAWLQLTWSSPITLNQVVLFDRPNLNDFVTNATLSFSDGSVVSTGSLDNAGAAVYVNFTARSTTSLRFTVVSVASTTSSAGLAELQAFNNPSAQIPAPSSASPPAAASSSSTRISIDLSSSPTSTAAASSVPAATATSAPAAGSSTPASPSSGTASASASVPTA